VKRFVFGIILAAILSLPSVVAWGGSMTLLGAGKPSAAAGYQGPGDVSGTSAYLFCGTIAYTNATIGQNAIRVTRRGDNASQDFATQSNGKVDSAAVSTFINGGGDTRGTIVTCYDQTGNGRDLTNTQIQAIEVVTSGQGGTVAFGSPNSFGNGFNQATGITVSQPFTVTFAGKRTANFTSENYAYGDITGTNVWGGWANIADTARMSAGTNRDASDVQDNGTTSDYHAFAHVFNNAGTSRLYVGTTSNAISAPGSNTIVSTFGLMAMIGQGGMTGELSYLAIWAADLHASGTADDVNSNVCTTLGFSC